MGRESSITISEREKWRWIVPVTFLIALAAFYHLSYPLLNDNDVPWHIAIGQLLITTHHLPKTDILAYGNQDQPWFILSWVWDLLLGVIQQIFGIFGTYIFTLVIGAGLTAGITSRLLKMNIALPAVLMTSVMTGLCLLDYITARPQLAGYVLAFIFHAILHTSRADTSFKHLRLLPLLMILWTNAHGSFMAGFVIIGAYGVEAWFTHQYDWLKRLVITVLACAVCGLINPYGPQVVLGALLSIKSPLTPYTAEWMPFSFGTSTGLSVWLVAVILASNLRGAGISIADKILAMGWFIATMFSVRNGAFFILLSAPYLATCLDEQTRGLRTPQPETLLVSFIKKQPLRRVWLGAIALFMLLCSVAYVMPHEEKIQSKDYSIKDSIDFALEHYPTHHFYTDFNFGGQVIFQAQGKLPFFMDSRASTAYSDEATQEYIDFLKLSDGWEEKLHKRHLNGLIVGKTTGFASSFEKGLYQKHWQLVFAGKRANVYIARP